MSDRNEASQKRRALLAEAKRRLGLMGADEIDTEFAAMENGLEIRLRFIAEPFVPLRRLSALSRRSGH